MGRNLQLFDARGPSRQRILAGGVKTGQPSPDYVDPYLNETTCDPDWAWAHGRGCLSLIQCFAKLGGGRIGSYRNLGDGGHVHDFSPSSGYGVVNTATTNNAGLYGYRGYLNAADQIPDQVWGFSSNTDSQDNPTFLIKLKENLDHGETGGVSDQLTMHVYLRWHDGGGDSRFISKSNSTAAPGHWWMLGEQGSGKIRVRLKTGGTTLTHISTSVELATDEFCLVSMVYDGAKVYIFHNGERVAPTDGFTQTGDVSKDPNVEVKYKGQQNQPQYGIFAWGGVWSYAWEHNDVRKLAGDVYGLFRTQRRIVVPVAGATPFGYDLGPDDSVFRPEIEAVEY